MEKMSIYSVLKSISVLVVCYMVQSCTMSGAPLLRESGSDGYGPLIPNCQNVSPKTNVLTYDTAFYHSTWTSAFIEGAQIGLKTGLDIENEENEFVRFEKEFAYAIMLQVFGVDGRNYPYPAFCMKYDAPIEKVKNQIAKILPALGNEIVKGYGEYGLFGTEFAERAHRAARWRDRYIINVGEMTSGGTVVTVFRELWISRGKEAFARAESDGHNEAWILKRVAAELK